MFLHTSQSCCCLLSAASYQVQTDSSIFLYNNIYSVCCTYLHLFLLFFPISHFICFFCIFYICLLRIKAWSFLITNWLLFLGTYQKKTPLCLLGFFNTDQYRSLQIVALLSLFLPPSNVDVAIVQCYASKVFFDTSQC